MNRDAVEEALHLAVVSQRQKIAELRSRHQSVTREEDLLNELELQLQKHEPILQENPQRFVVLPIQYTEVWKAYKRAFMSFWGAEDILLTDDIAQWNQQGDKAKLSADDKYFIKHILAFFAAADGIVNENLASRFFTEVQIPEARCFYGFQIMMENVHGEVYSLLIDTLVKDTEEKERLFKATENYPSIARLKNLALKWLDSKRPFSQRLIAFACVEGILFSGPFCAIFWLKKRGLLPGLTFSNELISRDEGLHQDFACLLNSMLKYPAPVETIHEIVKDFVSGSKEFISESLPCNLIGMNAAEMGKYIEYVGDRLLTNGLSMAPIWNTPNPFNWMELISTQNKTNFFEKRVGEYNKGKLNRAAINAIGNANSPQDEGIGILEDF